MALFDLLHDLTARARHEPARSSDLRRAPMACFTWAMPIRPLLNDRMAQGGGWPLAACASRTPTKPAASRNSRPASSRTSRGWACAGKSRCAYRASTSTTIEANLAALWSMGADLSLLLFAQRLRRRTHLSTSRSRWAAPLWRHLPGIAAQDGGERGSRVASSMAGAST